MTYGNNPGSRTSPLAVLGCIGIAAILVIAIAVGGYVFFGDRLGTDSSVAAEDSADDTGGDGDTEGGGAEEDADDDGDTGSGGGEGGTVQPGDLSYTFYSMTTDYGSVESHRGPVIEPDGQFVLVEMVVENHGSELITFSPVPTRMVDGQGIEYEHHIEATVSEKGNYASTSGVSANLEPGDDGYFLALYDIPADEDPSHLLVSDMSFGDPQANLDLH
ncbi:DUF4352 domain-containing protein [Nocardiopsis nanhaiensis]